MWLDWMILQQIGFLKGNVMRWQEDNEFLVVWQTFLDDLLKLELKNEQR